MNTAFRFYREVSDPAAERFWSEVSAAFEAIRANPEQHHFDRQADEFRRFNLKRFPFNILFEVMSDRIRVVVVRHNSRRASYGTGRK